MAIFLGTWLDGAGVPFDAAAHRHQQHAAGGTSQNNATVPDQTRLQIFTQTCFGNCVGVWSQHLSEADQAAWIASGWERVWEVRHKNFKQLYGHNHYLRTEMLPRYGFRFPLNGPPGYQGRKVVTFDWAQYWATSGVFKLHVLIPNSDQGSARSGFHIAQIAPEAVGTAYEYEMTHTILKKEIYPPGGVAEATMTATQEWPCLDGQQRLYTGYFDGVSMERWIFTPTYHANL